MRLTYILFSALIVFAACKKPCTLTLTQEQIDAGYTIVGSDKDCYIQEPGNTGVLNPNITSIIDLVAKMELIERDAADGKEISLQVLANLVPNVAQRNVLDALAEVLTHYPNVTIHYNGFSLLPAVEGLSIYFALWNDLGCPDLFASATKSGEWKGHHKWVVPGNEGKLFENAGQGNGVQNTGTANTTTTLNVKNAKEWNAIPQTVQNLIAQGGYTQVGIKLTGSGFDMDNGAGQGAAHWIYDSPNTSMLNNNFKRLGLEDSVTLSYEVVLMLKNANAWKALGWHQLPYVYDYTGKAPADMKIRVPETTPADPNLWVSVFPTTVNCRDIDLPLNVSKMGSEFRTNWTKNITITPRNQPTTPGGVPDVISCDDWFTSTYCCTNPYMAGDASAKFNFIVDEPLILSKHGRPTPPPGPEGMNLSKLDIGGGGNAWIKVWRSLVKANKHNPSPDDMNWGPQVNAVKVLPINILVKQADYPNYFTNEGQPRPIVDFYSVYQGGTLVNRLSMAGASMSNCVMYMGNEGSAVYRYNYCINEWGYTHEQAIEFLRSMYKISGNVELVMTMPAGKQALTVEMLYPE